MKNLAERSRVVLKNENILTSLITIRPIKIEDYQFILSWSKDIYFCLANGWENNRIAEQLYYDGFNV